MKKLLFISLLISVPAWGMEMGKKSEYIQLQTDETAQMTSRIIAKINKTKLREYLNLVRDLTEQEREENTKAALKVAETEKQLEKITHYLEEVRDAAANKVECTNTLLCCFGTQQHYNIIDFYIETDLINWYVEEQKEVCCKVSGFKKIKFNATPIKNTIQNLPWVKEVWTEEENAEKNDKRAEKLWPKKK